MTKELFGRRGIVASSLILAAVILTYYNALSNGFVYDDVPIVLKNPLVRDLANIPEVFLTGYWHSTGDSGGLYRPLTILSYLFEFAVAGEDPLLYHLDNVILHFLCCLLVYAVVARLTANHAGSAAAAVLFAVHPVHAEAVAWISGRSDLLSSFLTLAGLYVFICNPKRLPWYVASPALMFLGLLAKETAIVLPVLVLVYVLVFERDGRGKSVKDVALAMVPYAAVTALFLLIRLYVLEAGLYPQSTGQVLVFTKGYWRVLVMFRVFLEYMRNSVWPADLQIHYMLRPPDTILSVTSLLFLGITGTLAAASPWLIRNRPAYFIFMAWFFITLLPVSNIVPIGILMSDRAMYLPSVSVCALAGLVVSWAGGVDATTAKPGFRAVAAGLALTAVAITFGYMAHQRNQVWHDTKSVSIELVSSFNRVIDEFPESTDYYIHVAGAYIEMEMYEEAASVLNKSLEIDPELSYNRNVLSKVYNKMGRTDLAMQELRVLERASEQKVALDPGNADYHVEYGYVLTGEDKDDEALAEFNKAIEINPGIPSAHFGRGIILGSRDEFEAALGSLYKAVELEPGNANYRYYLAAAYLSTGDSSSALKELEEAIRLNPDMQEARELMSEIRQPDNRP